MIEVDFRAYKILIPKRYSAILSYPPAEDFVVAAYLAILITNATRAGRSAMDTTRFAVARYHGMYTMVRAAQIAVKDDINWPPVEAELLQQGHKDEVAYIHEVIQ